jgi:hypothetical protein
MNFTITPHFDEDNYPYQILISDSENLLGTFRRPLLFSMAELERLYNAIKPLCEAYKIWAPLHEKFMYGELSFKPKWPKIKKEVKKS